MDSMFTWLNTNDRFTTLFDAINDGCIDSVVNGVACFSKLIPEMAHRTPNKGNLLSVVRFSFYERPIFDHQDCIQRGIGPKCTDVVPGELVSED